MNKLAALLILLSVGLFTIGAIGCGGPQGPAKVEDMEKNPPQPEAVPTEGGGGPMDAGPMDAGPMDAGGAPMP